MDILEMLNKGMAPDAIMSSFKADLDAAVAAKKKAEEEKAASKEKLEAEKKAAREAILNSMIDYFNKYYNAEIEIEIDTDEADWEDYVKTFDTLGSLLQNFKGLF